jgi:hypothetical protein
VGYSFIVSVELGQSNSTAFASCSELTSM